MANGEKKPLLERMEKYLNEEILIVTTSDQLNIFGQAFRPIFTGTLHAVEFGHITLSPAIIKMVNAPFFEFPVPLSIPMEKIVHFSPDFDSKKRFPIT